MAVMDVVLDIERFWIEVPNEGNRSDEPYLITVFAKFDAEGMPSPLIASTRRAIVHVGSKAHGSLGAKADEMPQGKSNAIDVPDSTGRWRTRLVTLPGLTSAIADAATSVLLIVVAAEEDVTSDSAAEAGRVALGKEIRAQLNTALQGLSLSSGSPTLTPAQEVAISNQVTAAVEDAVLGATLDPLAFAAVSSVFKVIALLDHDDPVGFRFVGPVSFRSIWLAGRTGVKFTLKLNGNDEGRYAVSGVIRRDDFPAAVAALAVGRTVMVSARADDTSLVHMSLENRTEPEWIDDFPPQARFSSGPTLTSFLPGRVDIFARGNDRRIWQSWRQGSGGWNDFIPLKSGKFQAGPAAVSQPGTNTLDLFAVGDDDHIWQIHYDGQWSDWTKNLGKLSSGRFLPAQPSATSWGSGRLDLFALGTDRGIYHASRTGQTWTTWSRIGSGRFMSGPAATSWGANRLDVVAMGDDRRIYHSSWINGVGWTAWTALGIGTFFCGPGLTTAGPDRLEVFAVGDDRRLWRRTYSRGWKEWEGPLGSSGWRFT